MLHEYESKNLCNDTIVIVIGRFRELAQRGQQPASKRLMMITRFEVTQRAALDR